MKKNKSVNKSLVRKTLIEHGITMERTTNLSGNRAWQLSNGERYASWSEVGNMVFERYLKKEERDSA